jgi:hypothetical protein
MNFPEVPGESNLMYIFKVIGQMIANLFRNAWRARLALASGAKGARDRRRQARQGVSEAERLDRIRQPWKYAGK